MCILSSLSIHSLLAHGILSGQSLIFPQQALWFCFAHCGLCCYLWGASPFNPKSPRAAVNPLTLQPWGSLLHLWGLIPQTCTYSVLLRCLAFVYPTCVRTLILTLNCFRLYKKNTEHLIPFTYVHLLLTFYPIGFILLALSSVLSLFP